MNRERTLTADEDSQLVARFQRGETAAFDALFERYQDYVYRILYGIVGSAEESRDLTQDVFMQVYRSLGGFRQGSRFATWLYRIAVNRGVDATRGARRWRFLSLLESPQAFERPAERSEEPDQVFARGAEQKRIQEILMRCSVKHRQILVLRYYQDLSTEEIAETLGCSVAAAKVRLFRARNAFKDQYVIADGQECHAQESRGSAEGRR